MDIVQLKEILKYKLNDEQNLFNYRLLLDFEASQIHFEDIYSFTKRPDQTLFESNFIF